MAWQLTRLACIMAMATNNPTTVHMNRIVQLENENNYLTNMNKRLQGKKLRHVPFSYMLLSVLWGMLC
jgi:hypothetical protein